jgi:hypothetical protein
MTEDEVVERPWRLVNLKVPHDTLKRIDDEAVRRGMTRTSYMIARSDPKKRRVG